MKSSPNNPRHRRQRPHYEAGATNPRQSTDSRRSNQKRSSSIRNQLYLFVFSIGGIATWYLTPLADYVVDLILMQVPIEADIDLGKEALRNLPYKTIDHPKWTPLIKSVGWELVSSSMDRNAKHYQWDFGVVDASTVNAIALPGGTVRVTLALLDQLDLTEGELAALVAHELGHVLCRHSQARLLQRKVIGTLFDALTYHDDDDYEESFGEAIGELLLESADWLGQLAFSRKDEYQADSVGWDLLKKSKRYNPQTLKSVLGKLWKLNGNQGGKTSWESTHPGTLERIEALEHLWNALPLQDRRRLRNTVQ